MGWFILRRARNLLRHSSGPLHWRDSHNFLSNFLSVYLSCCRIEWQNFMMNNARQSKQPWGPSRSCSKWLSQTFQSDDRPWWIPLPVELPVCLSFIQCLVSIGILQRNVYGQIPFVPRETQCALIALLRKNRRTPNT